MEQVEPFKRSKEVLLLCVRVIVQWSLWGVMVLGHCRVVSISALEGLEWAQALSLMHHKKIRKKKKRKKWFLVGIILGGPNPKQGLTAKGFALIMKN